MQSGKRLLIARNPFKTVLILGLLLGLCDNGHSQASRILIVQQNEGVRDFSAYIAEILLAEGLVEHELKRLAELSPGDLGKYRVAILPPGSYTSDQLDRIDSYVKSGGHLISFLPQPSLSKRLGLEAESELTAERGYIHFETSRSEALGLVSESLQIHGPSRLYTAPGIRPLAWFGKERPSKDVSILEGDLGQGRFVVFAYDLPWSIALTRQGNPAWADQENDAVGGLRPNDMFLRGEDHWIDSAKVMIPQADQQMHFLTGILRSLTEPQTLPRVWYFPAGADAVFILTSDHEFGTASDMEAVRRDMQSLEVPLTIYLTRPYGEGGAPSAHVFHQSWEPNQISFGVHFEGGSDILFPNQAQMRSVLQRDVREFRAIYGLPVQTTRMHNLRWMGWITQARLLAEVGVGMDYTYVNFIPVYDGYMTGSGLPMRYVDRFGRTADIFQQLTQYEDDVIISQMFYSSNWSTEEALTRFRELLKNSITRFHTAITINFHPPFYLFPIPDSINSNKAWTHGCIEIAKEMEVPIVSGDQWHDFVRARSQVRIRGFRENASGYEFFVDTPQKVQGLSLMIPSKQKGQTVQIDGRPVTAYAKKVRERDYLFVTEDFAGTNLVRIAGK